jgi:DNA polymerase-3 subunit beta
MTTKALAKTATVDTRKLYEALRKVNYVKPHPSLTILSNTCAEFSNGKVALTTTNLETVVRIEIDSTNTEAFPMLLPRKLTERFVSGGNGKTSITQGKLDKQVALSRSGMGYLNLTVPLTTEFPPIPKVPDTLQWQTLDGKWFCRMLRFVSVACADALSRPVLNGVACNDGAMAAADGFRIHVLKDSRLTFGLGDKQAIIPLETINLVTKLFSKEEYIEVAFESGNINPADLQRVHFKSGGVSLVSQLIQGNYPQYMQLVPNTFQTKVSFSSPLMVQRLNMIDVREIPSGIVKYDFRTMEHGEQLCSISAHAEDNYGEQTYNLSCPVKLEVNEGKIAFNYQYFMDAIKPFSLCNLELLSLSSPGKFTGDIEGLVIVVMPMFVQW